MGCKLDSRLRLLTREFYIGLQLLKSREGNLGWIRFNIMENAIGGLTIVTKTKTGWCFSQSSTVGSRVLGGYRGVE